MSDPAPPSRFGGGDPDGDPAAERHVVFRTIKRVRAFVVLVPLVVVVLVAASIGAEKLWADIPVRDTAGPDVTCWNGTTAPAVECTEPRGKRGLRWVFPSYQPKDERCVRTEARSYDIACTLRFDQRSVTITYAARRSTGSLIKAVRAAYTSRPASEAGGERIRFEDNRPDDDGLYRTTILYADHPFAVTVTAPAVDVRDGALDELVDFRPADEVTVRG